MSQQKDYDYEVFFSIEQNRWVAKFQANKFPISYTFPLRDSLDRPNITCEESDILGLVFTQMVGLVVAASARQAPPVAASRSLSETEKALS